MFSDGNAFQGGPGSTSNLESSLNSLNETLKRIQGSSNSINFVTGDQGAGFKVASGFAENSFKKVINRMSDASLLARKFGVDLQTAMDQGSYSIQNLTSNLNRMKFTFMSIPSRLRGMLMSGASDETQRVSSAAGIVRSEYAGSIGEGRLILSKVLEDVRKNSAPLPGDTNTHLLVLQNTIDDSMQLAKYANKSQAEAQEFSGWVAGQIGSIAGVQGADAHSTIRFANALMSGNLSANSQLDLVERNPALKAAIKESMKERGVRTLGEVSKSQRMDALKDILSKAFTDEQMKAGSQTFESTLQTFSTTMSDLVSSTRTLALQGNVEITIFRELKNIAGRLITPLTNLGQAVIASGKLDPSAIIQKGLSKVYGLMGGTGRDNDTIGRMSMSKASNLGFFDYLQWVEASLEEGSSQIKTILGPNGVWLEIVRTLRVKFVQGFTSMMAELHGVIRYVRVGPSHSLAEGLAETIATMFNAFAEVVPSVVIIAKDFLIQFFTELKNSVNPVALLVMAREITTLNTIWEGVLSSVSKAISGSEAVKSIKGKVTAVISALGLFLAVVTMFSAKLLDRLFYFIGSINQLFLKFVNAISQFVNTFIRQRQIMDPNNPMAGVYNLVESKSNRLQTWTNQRIDPNHRYWNAGDPNNIVTPPGKFIAEMNQKAKTSSSFFDSINPFKWLENIPEIINRREIAAGRPAKYQTGKKNIYDNFMEKFGPARQVGVMMAGASNPLLGVGMQVGFGMADLLNTGVKMQKRGTFISKLGVFNKFFNSIGGTISKFMAGAAPKLLGMVSGLIQFLPYITMWFGAFTALFALAYKASPKLRQAVQRFFSGFQEVFNNIRKAVEKFVSPVVTLIVRIMKPVGDFLAWFLNRVMDLLGFAKNPSVEDAGKVSELLVRKESRAIDEEIASSKWMGTIRTASSGLNNALYSEMVNKPSGSNLVIANSSESIRTIEQERLLQQQLKNRAQGTNINIVVNSSVNATPEEQAREIARVLEAKLRSRGDQ